jgi:uncharacterized phage protein (TIGR01671 family)
LKEIKFRAWDKANKKMIAVPSLHFGDDGASHGASLTIIIWDKTAEMYDRALVVSETAELMQYTGFKDKNGKEIYEGDILKIYTLYSDVKIEAVVFDMYSFMTSGGYFLYAFDEHYEIEVIGNIYENPELIPEEE